MESNKIFAAVLVAGIVAMLSGFTAKRLIPSHTPEKDSYVIEVAETPKSGAPVKKKVAEPVSDLLASADVARGKKLSKACAACHSFTKGGPHRVGPNLWDVVGKDIASNAGFSYSDVMSAKEGKWDYETIGTFLWKPKKFAPGTKMSYIGMKKTKDRANLIAWLRTLSEAPVALPAVSVAQDSDPAVETDSATKTPVPADAVKAVTEVIEGE